MSTTWRCPSIILHVPSWRGRREQSARSWKRRGSGFSAVGEIPGKAGGLRARWRSADKVGQGGSLAGTGAGASSIWHPTWSLHSGFCVDCAGNLFIQFLCKCSIHIKLKARFHFPVRKFLKLLLRFVWSLVFDNETLCRDHLLRDSPPQPCYRSGLSELPGSSSVCQVLQLHTLWPRFHFQGWNLRK